MPFYEYECSSCKFYSEVMQKITDAPLTKCPSCGKKSLQKLVSAPNFRLKGGGWYETDFKSEQENKRNLVAADKEEAATKAEPAAEGAKADATKGESKPEGAKPESKADREPSEAKRPAVKSPATRSHTAKKPASRAPVRASGRGKSVKSAAKPRPVKAKGGSRKKARR